MKTNDIWFQNLQSLESTLSTAIFHEDGVEGYWYVEQEDLYSSNSYYKDFFVMAEAAEKGDMSSEVVFEVKDYDLVGPPDFHKGFEQYSRPSSGKPWFQMQIKLHSQDDRQMNIKAIFPMTDNHLLINREKSSFRAQTPKVLRVETNGEHPRECKNVTIQF